MKNQPTILLLTHHRDFFVIDRVKAALEQQGARAIRVNTDRFPVDLKLSASWNGELMAYALDDGESVVHSEEVSAVWTRSFWPADGLEQVPSHHREGCRKQIRHVLQGFLDGLGHARWISPHHRLVTAGNKIHQLRLAAQVGITIPESLVTNDPEQVRAFYDRHDGEVVTKLPDALERSMTRSEQFVPTSDLSEDDLQHLDSLKFSPMIFQTKIKKARELRIKYVDGNVFVGAVEAQGTTGATDWRQAGTMETGWQPGSIPMNIHAAIGRLMGSLGLLAGAIDLIVTPEGEHVFLEVNPTGEWGMLERDLNLPIASAVAAALLNKPFELPAATSQPSEK